MNVFFREGGDQPVPVGHADRVDMVDVLSVFGLHRGRDALHSLQELAVQGGVPAPPLGPVGEVLELHAQDRPLDPVHPGVPPDQGVVILFRLPVVAQHPHLFVEFLVVGDDGPGLAIGPQVLPGVKAEAPRVPDRTRLLPLVLRPVGLGGVLDDEEFPFSGDLHNGVHVRHLPEQVDRDDRPGLRRDGRLDLRGIHVVGRRVHVDEDRLRSAPADRLGGGDERVRHGDHFVPGPDSKAEQGCPKGVRAAPHPGGELRPAERGELLFELRHERAARERGLVEHLLDRVRDLPADRLVLGFQVQVGNLHRFFSSVIFRSTFAGFPATIIPGGTSFVTTLPAPTIDFSPTVTPARIVTLEPTDAPFLMNVGMQTQSASVWSPPPSAVDRGYMSLMKVTLWPMNTSSSIVTPSQMKVWLEILQFFPIFAPFWISTKVPILLWSPISHPYRLTKSYTFTPSPNFTVGAISWRSPGSIFIAFLSGRRREGAEVPVDLDLRATVFQGAGGG